MCSPALAPSLPAVSAHTMSAWSTITFFSGHTHKHTYTHKVRTLAQNDFTAPLTCFVLPPASTMMKASIGFCSDPGGLALLSFTLLSFPFSFFPFLKKFAVSGCSQDLFSLISPQVSVSLAITCFSFHTANHCFLNLTLRMQVATTTIFSTRILNALTPTYNYTQLNFGPEV